MATKNELPRTPLALAVMNLLIERPMHPYEMRSTMQGRGHDQVIKLKGGSLYDTVDRLERGGFITAQETSRDGRRPERTVYAITDRGREEIQAWLRELLAHPAKEYPQFAAALAFVAALDKDEVVRLLKVRATLLESQVAGDEKALESWTTDMGLPRLFLVEGEYGLVLKRAELDWLRRLIRDIEEGDLWVTPEQAAAVVHRLEPRTQGGDKR